MEDSNDESDSKHAVEYSVSLSGNNQEHREFRELIRRSEAEIQFEKPSDTTGEGRPQYLQNMINDCIEALEEKDHCEAMEPAVEVATQKVTNMAFYDGFEDRTVYDVLQDLQQFDHLITYEIAENASYLEEGQFNHYRRYHLPYDLHLQSKEIELDEQNKNKWAEATLKAILHASLEDYLAQKVRSNTEVDTVEDA